MRRNGADVIETFLLLIDQLRQRFKRPIFVSIIFTKSVENIEGGLQTFLASSDIIISSSSPKKLPEEVENLLFA